MSSSPVSLSPPTSPLTRQIAVPSEEGFMNTRIIYWNRCHCPPLYREAIEFENINELHYTDALIAIASAWEKYPNLQLCVGKPRGYDFQIFFGSPSPSATPIQDLGINTETALTYLACDYIRYRYAGDTLGMTDSDKPKNWMRLYTHALEHAGRLHLDILSQMYQAGEKN